MSEFTYTVKKEDEGLTTGELLRRNFHFSSRLLTKIKKQDLTFLNGVPVRGWMIPAPGDILTVSLPEESSDFPPEDIPIDVIYEDESLLIINKQPGIVVHPTRGKPVHTIANGVMKLMLDRGQNYKIRFANRLDMNTSGLLIVAKTGFTQDRIIRQMKAGITEKKYLAVLDGIIEPDEGTINSPIGRPDPNEVERWILPVEQGGFESVTHYSVISRYPDIPGGMTLAKISLQTGRTHQIRVHMASIGHPVTGDHLYNNGDPFLYRRLHGDFRREEGENEKSTSPYIDRQALHACFLSFYHPVSGRPVSFEAPLPKDMQDLIKKAGGI